MKKHDVRSKQMQLEFARFFRIRSDLLTKEYNAEETAFVHYLSYMNAAASLVQKSQGSYLDNCSFMTTGEPPKLSSGHNALCFLIVTFMCLNSASNISKGSLVLMGDLFVLRQRWVTNR